MLSQTAHCEVLVIDDASEDGTAEMVATEFPGVRVDRSESALGLIAQRNRAARLARGRIIVSVDDDAELDSPHTVARTLEEFDHPRIGAVAIPFVDVRHGPQVRQRAPDRERRWITSSYIGTAHALRRDVFLALGGYRAELVRQHEEPDYCLRMLDAGYVTRLGSADELRHFESPKRDMETVFVNERRNLFLHGWHNVPMPYLPVRLAKITVSSVPPALRFGRPADTARGLAQGWLYGLRARRARHPVSRAAYRVDHMLRKRGPLPLEEIEPLLPAPVPLHPTDDAAVRS